MFSVHVKHHVYLLFTLKKFIIIIDTNEVLVIKWTETEHISSQDETSNCLF